MKIAIFVSGRGVEKVLPAGDGGLEEVEGALRLYGLLRAELSQFDAAVKRRLAGIDLARPPEADDLLFHST